MRHCTATGWTTREALISQAATHRRIAAASVLSIKLPKSEGLLHDLGPALGTDVGLWSVETSLALYWTIKIVVRSGHDLDCCGLVQVEIVT